jgi:hypothetical protein
MWQLRVSLDIEIREVALRIECQTAAALGVERLWLGARQVLTDNRRSMKSARLVQWLRLFEPSPALRRGDAAEAGHHLVYV